MRYILFAGALSPLSIHGHGSRSADSGYKLTIILATVVRKDVALGSIFRIPRPLAINSGMTLRK
jgi:hypothetical protein